MDPLLFGVATNLATDVLKAAYRRSRDIGLGDGETRALRRAFTRAFGVLTADVAQARQEELTPDLVALVEGQLRRLVTDTAMAEMLLSAAVEEREPDLARLRERFEELGFDPRTFLTDFDTAMSRFRYALADELLQAAGNAGSPLFNRVVLAQLAAVRDQLAHLAGRSGADDPGTPAGRPVREWTDPFTLEVHPAIDGGAGRADALPPYIRREHDAELGRVVAGAIDSGSVIRVLVGGSSTGKTRACWEALRLLPDTWRLWHPISPSRSEALIGGLAAVGPHTVLWLNDLHYYLLHDQVCGERVAAGLRELLRDQNRGPVLVLGTIWPEYWARLTMQPSTLLSDPHAQARSLLTGADLVVPESFAEPDRERAVEAARSDARLRDALEHAMDGEVTQYLAGAPALLERYRTAPPAAKAVIEAAMDVRRLGHSLDLSEELLRRAAPGYLTGRQRDGLAEDWFKEAMAYTGAPCRGVSGPVAGPPRDASPSVYRLADYLDQWARRTRATVLVPASTWDALQEYGPDQDLPAIAEEADRRHLYRRAAELYQPAAEAGNVNGLRLVAHYLAVVGEVDEALTLYERAADAGYSLALQEAAQALADLGLVDTSLTYWRMAADAGNADHCAVICAARNLARAGRLDEALEWWERAADPDDGDLVWYNHTLRLRCWADHRIPRGILDWTVHEAFGNTGAQLALLDAARALHRAGRLSDALHWYERAADVERSQVVTWSKRRDLASEKAHEKAQWLAERLDARSARTVTDPADVFYKVAWDGHELAVVHGAQALAEAGDTAGTVRWLFNHISDEGQAVTVAAQVFRIAGRDDQAIEWIEHDDCDLAVRVRASPWADAFRKARREIYRGGRLDFAGVVNNNTYGAEKLDILEPRGGPYASEIQLARYNGLDLADLQRQATGGDVEVLTAIATQHRAAGRTEEAITAYLHSAECGEKGFSEAIELLRQAGREDDAERLARFGLEPGGVIGHHPTDDFEPPPQRADATEKIVGVWLRRWRHGGNAFGQAVLRAAADILQCGYCGVLSADLLGAVAGVYLADLGIPPMEPERLQTALAWAGEPVADGVAALRRHDDGYHLLSPLFDAIVADPDCQPVPEAVWRAVAEHAAPEECWSIAEAAHEAGQAEIAESTGRRGAEHGDTLAMYVLSNVLRAAGRDDEAARWLNGAAEAGEPNALRTLADESAAQGRTDEAIARYRRAGDWAASFNLGVLLHREGRLAEAEEAFRAALPDGPPVVAHNLGIVLWTLGHPAEAEPYFAQAAAGGYTRARAELAHLLLELGRDAEAEVCYLSAISLGAVELVAEYGELLERHGRGGEALRLYRRMVDAGEFGVVPHLADRLAEQGKTALLTDLFRHGADAGDAYCKNRLAILLVDRGDLDQAERLYRETIASGFLVARNNLALLLQRRGDQEQAEELLRAAAADGDVNAMNNLGLLLCDQQRLDDAEPFLQQAMAAGNVNAVNNLGLLQQARGRRTEAERLFRLAAEAGNLQAPGNLGRLLSEGEAASSA